MFSQVSANGNDGKVRGHLTRDVAVVQVGVVMGPIAQSGSAFSSLRFLSGINEQARAASGVLTVSMDTLRKFDDVLAANDVYIMGYPSSMGIQQAPQIDYTTPLIRKGIVAGKNRSNKTIVLDCLTFFGNSGGPVLQTAHSGSIVRIDVIGVVFSFSKSSSYLFCSVSFGSRE